MTDSSSPEQRGNPKALLVGYKSLYQPLKRGFSAFTKATTFESKIALIFFTLLIIFVLASLVYVPLWFYYAYRTFHAPPTEHLQIAVNLCRPGSSTVSCTGADSDEAIRHLEEIPPSAPEYSEASKLRSLIKQSQEKQRAIQQQLYEKRHTEIERLKGQSEKESRTQMQKNVAGLAHDSFLCGVSKDNTSIVSFDFGHYWWADDGRCAARQQQAQRERDQAAEPSSNVPTTLRVETDIDSSWLQNEERMCRTYPDVNGHVSRVICNASGLHQQHNIPIRFWGGVDRNTVSNWKCTKEGGLSGLLDSAEFACRAID